MSDLIDRQALFKQIEIDSEGIEGSYGDTWKFIDTIKNMPSVDVAIDLQPTCNQLATDCISRQQAIDAIEAMQMPIMRSTFAEEQFVFRGMSDALNAIKELPSAEPQIVRCKDCKHLFNKDDEGGKCWHFNGFSKVVSYDDFCSRAERRTDGQATE